MSGGGGGMSQQQNDINSRVGDVKDYQMDQRNTAEAEAAKNPWGNMPVAGSANSAFAGMPQTLNYTPQTIQTLPTQGQPAQQSGLSGAGVNHG